MLQHGDSVYRNQCFGYPVGQGLEPGSQPGGKYHGFHV